MKTMKDLRERNIFEFINEENSEKCRFEGKKKAESEYDKVFANHEGYMYLYTRIGETQQRMYRTGINRYVLIVK